MKKIPSYKSKESSTWYVVTPYTGWTGAQKRKCKRCNTPASYAWQGHQCVDFGIFLKRTLEYQKTRLDFTKVK